MCTRATHQLVAELRQHQALGKLEVGPWHFPDLAAGEAERHAVRQRRALQQTAVGADLGIRDIDSASRGGFTWDLARAATRGGDPCGVLVHPRHW
jgi:hypothetical protein